MTPPAAAALLLANIQASRVHLAAVGSLAEDFQKFELVDNTTSDVDAIVLGDLYLEFTWGRLNTLFQMMARGVPLVALHKNRICQRAEGLSLDLGPFVAALEYAAAVQAPHAPGRVTRRTVMPALIVYPRSGGGKAARFDLIAQCAKRGIETIILEPGDDLAALAETAIRNGPDAVGMAGGDGSQATVAAVAAEHDVAFVCVPAGTRNHFAFDLGIDRNDVVAALDVFDDGTERRIDLGRVNGRVFVNNVAMGVYGAVVESPAYRDHKMRTVMEMLPQLVGPRAERFDLRFAGRDGAAHDSALLILVSNNPYGFDPRPQFGTRGTLDDGVLGVITVPGPPHGPEEWST
jgi:diacylglycerol kinase family enzyme